MKVDEAIDILWECLQKGEYFPAALQGQLTLEEAYQVQLGVLARRVAAGERQAGWKIALSGVDARQAMGVHAPAFGYLLASGHYTDGETFELDTILNPAIESELCMTLSQRLKGPGMTREQVRDAVTKVAAAFELVSLRGSLAADLTLGVADNIAQWGFVTGDEVTPYPKDLNLADLTAEIVKNDRIEAQARSGDAMDDQLDSIAWLANELAKYDVALEAGHQVITGTFVRPLPIAKGDTWITHFSSVGTVSASFV